MLFISLMIIFLSAVLAMGVAALIVAGRADSRLERPDLIRVQEDKRGR